MEPVVVLKSNEVAAKTIGSCCTPLYKYSRVPPISVPADTRDIYCRVSKKQSDLSVNEFVGKFSQYKIKDHLWVQTDYWWNLLKSESTVFFLSLLSQEG